MSQFKLLTLRQRRKDGLFAMKYSTPSETIVQEDLRLPELRRLSSFWADRGQAVTFSQSGTEQTPDFEIARNQAEQTAKTEQTEAARVKFLLEQFPTWPASCAALLAFAKKTGCELSNDAVGASAETLWETIFGEVVPE